MTVAIISAALACVASIVAAAITFVTQRAIKKKDANEAALAAAKKKESIILMELHSTSSEFCYALACAVKRGTPNGEIEKAKEKYETIKAKYDSFIKEQAVERLAQN